MDARSPEPKLDVWSGLSFSVDEIGKAYTTAIDKLSAVNVDSVTTPYQDRYLIGLKLACESMADACSDARKCLESAENLSAHLARTIAKLVNRHPHT